MILKQIGKGGMSEVFLCEDLLLHTHWAGKRIWKKQDENSKLAYQSLKVETDMLAKLKHKCIPTIIDCFDSNECYIVIMDLVEGNSLHQKVLYEKVDENEILKWAEDILNILHYLHHEVPCPIVFRDLKPENLLLTHFNEIMLIDFGIALYVHDEKVDSSPCLGTRGYASKEQSNPGFLDTRSDLYSFGATLFFLYTKSIYRGEEIPHNRLHDIMNKCLQDDIQKRYQDVDEILKDLHKITKRKAYKRQYFLLSILCLSLSCFSNYQYQNMMNKQYHQYVRNQEYEQAILLNPMNKEAYVYYYEQNKQESIAYAIQKMEHISLDHLSTEDKEEMLYEMAFDCFRMNQLDYYRLASSYLRQIKHKDVHNFLRLCEMASQYNGLTYKQIDEYVGLLNDLETEATSAIYPKQKVQIFEILVRLYTLQKEAIGYLAYESILRVAEMGEKITLHEHKDGHLYEYYSYFCETKVLAYGYLGNFLNTQGQNAKAQQYFQQMMETFEIYQQKGIPISAYLHERIQQIKSYET